MDRRAQIKNFFEGKLTGEQAGELLEWIHSNEGEVYLSTEIDQVWAEKIKKQELDNLDTEVSWQKIRANCGFYHRPVDLRSAGKTTKVVPLWVKVACSIALFGVVFWALLVTNKPAELPIPATVDHLMVTKYNPPGQKTRVHLSDGSIVILNSDSKIKYPADFPNNRRIVLEGEAFFTVNKDSLNPFRVVAKGIVTTALGTSFNVSTFVKDEHVKVTLVSGQVRLNKEDKENHLILNPGEESIVSDAVQEFSKTQVDVNKSIVWIDGILTFQNTPFMQVIDLLGRWYGVNFEVKGKITPSLCSGTFQKNEMLDNVLEVLSSSVGFKYKLDGKNVSLYF